MSAVVDAIVDVFEAVVTITLTITLIGPVLALVSEDFKDWYLDELGEIFSLFGIEDEDVVETQVLDQRLMDDEAVKNLLTKVALDHQDTQRSIIDLLSTYTARTRGSMNSYFDYGKNTYVYGLPDTNIRASSVPTEATINQIKLETGEPAVYLDTKYVRVPTKEEYVYHQLDSLYGYRPYTNKMTYLGFQYTLKFIDYNYDTNNYDCTVYRAGIERTETTITITPVDATNDNKHTYVKISIILAEETIIISETNTDVLIPKNSEVDSYTVVNANTEYGTTVVSLVAFSPVVHIVVRWYAVDNSQWRSWTYELGSGVAALDNAQRYLGNLDMLPIVELRNNRVNVADNTTTELYAQSRDMLELIGVDIHTLTDSLMENPDIGNVEDAYIYFGVDLKDTSPTIAKMMYSSIEFFYYDSSLQSNAGAYKITIQEGKFNQTIMWKEQTRTTVAGVLGPVNTYQMTTSGNTLIVRKQETLTQYIEYQMVDIGATTFIRRGAYWGITQKTLLSDTVRFPVSFFQMDQLTPIEQLEVFGKTLRLQTYAISVTHLEWYETSAFMNLIKIVVYVIAAVLFVLSLPAGGSGAKAWLIFAGKMLIMYGASLAIQKIMESSAPMWLKAVLSLLVMAAAAYGAGSLDAGHFLTPAEISKSVIEWASTVGASSTKTIGAVGSTLSFGSSLVQAKLAEDAAQLNQEMAYFRGIIETKVKDLTDAQGRLEDYLDTEFVASLAAKGEVTGFLESFDYARYRAGPILYDQVFLSVGGSYDTVYNYYDRMLKVGVASFENS